MKKQFPFIISLIICMLLAASCTAREEPAPASENPVSVPSAAIEAEEPEEPEELSEEELLRLARNGMTELVLDADNLVELDCASDYTSLKTLTVRSLGGRPLAELAGFTGLEVLDLRSLAPSPEDIDELSALLPDCDIQWIVPICGMELDSGTQELDLRDAEDLSGIENLQYLKALTVCDLRGRNLSYEEMETFSSYAPRAELLFSFTVCGVETDGTAEELILNSRYISDPEFVEKFLPYMKRLEKVEMCNCGLSNSQMAALREKFPQIKFVWTVRMGQYILRTDVVAYSTLVATNDTPRITSPDIEVLKYCTDLEALDLGHNYITDISVLSNLPKLRVLILSDNAVSDLTPLADLKELRFLEFFSNHKITDIAPLAGLTNLVDLNMSYTSATDFEPLFGLDNLQNLWMNGYELSDAEREAILSSIPEGCRLSAEDIFACQGGWREREINPRHFLQYDMFRGNYIDEWFYENP